MSTLLIQSRVKDYTTWKKQYDSMKDFRSSYGAISDKIYRDANDPNKLIIIFKWDSIERAQKYAQSSELKTAMQKAGVEGQPTFSFLTEA
jgi:heme-degrading monooxygenase HmoA